MHTPNAEVPQAQYNHNQTVGAKNLHLSDVSSINEPATCIQGVQQLDGQNETIVSRVDFDRFNPKRLYTKLFNNVGTGIIKMRP